jgi:hypothetical protein
MRENASISSQSSSTKFASSNETEPPPQDVVVEDSKLPSRFVWPKIKKTTIKHNGEMIPGYRFIQNTNRVDRIFVDVVHEIEPFLGIHREKTDLWKEVQIECKNREPTLFAGFEFCNGQDRLKAQKGFWQRQSTATNRFVVAH